MLPPREKNPSSRKNSPQRRMEPTTLHQAGQRAQHTTNELFRPPATHQSNLLPVPTVTSVTSVLQSTQPPTNPTSPLYLLLHLYSSPHSHPPIQPPPYTYCYICTPVHTATHQSNLPPIPTVTSVLQSTQPPTNPTSSLYPLLHLYSSPQSYPPI